MNQPPCIVALWQLSGQNKTSSISNIIMLIQVAFMWRAVFPLNGGGRDLGMQRGLTSLTDPFLFLSSKKALKMRHQLQVYAYKDEWDSWVKTEILHRYQLCLYLSFERGLLTDAYTVTRTIFHCVRGTKQLQKAKNSYLRSKLEISSFVIATVIST